VADSQRLDVPRGRTRRLGSFLRLNPDAVGQFAEGIARFLGTGRFLAVQTIIVVVWIALNVAAVDLRWDPYPFILLNLAFSTQAAYAAPLILLAQNRQELRDRAQTETDRRVAERTQADAEFLAREIASVRLALGDMVTTEDLDDRLQKLGDSIEKLSRQLGTHPTAPEPAPTPVQPDEPRSRRAVG
jgi:uncharacterized membrane protein